MSRPLRLLAACVLLLAASAPALAFDRVSGPSLIMGLGFLLAAEPEPAATPDPQPEPVPTHAPADAEDTLALSSASTPITR